MDLMQAWTVIVILQRGLVIYPRPSARQQFTDQYLSTGTCPRLISRRAGVMLQGVVWVGVHWAFSPEQDATARKRKRQARQAEAKISGLDNVTKLMRHRLTRNDTRTLGPASVP
jgi:hypothetical protein